MNADRVALFGFQLSVVGGLVLVDDGHQFGLFFPFGWTFVLLGLFVTMVTLLFE